MTPRKQGKWGRVYQRGTRWWIAFYAPTPDGKRRLVREAAGDTEEDGDRLLARRYTEVVNADAGVVAFQGPEQKRLTVGALLDAVEADWKVRNVRSIRSLTSHANTLRRHIGGTRAASVTGTTVQRYVSSRRAEKVADSTIDRELEILRHAFLLAVDDRRFGWSIKVPKLVSFRANRRDVALSPEQIAAVVSRVESRGFADALEFFASTGWRPREIGTLTWEDYQRHRKLLRLRPENEKTGKGRPVPVAGPLVAILARRDAARRLDCPLIFHDEGKPILCKRERGGFRDPLEREFRRAVAAARKADPELWLDMPDRIIPYDLRRSAKLVLALADVPVATQMLILGHRNREMSDSYLAEEAMVRALERTSTKVGTETKGSGSK